MASPGNPSNPDVKTVTGFNPIRLTTPAFCIATLIKNIARVPTTARRIKFKSHSARRLIAPSSRTHAHAPTINKMPVCPSMPVPIYAASLTFGIVHRFTILYAAGSSNILKKDFIGILTKKCIYGNISVTYGYNLIVRKSIPIKECL